MTPDVISLGGAAYRTSFILSFATKKEWIDDRMKGDHSAFCEKTPETRKTLFAQIYDLAKKK